MENFQNVKSINLFGVELFQYKNCMEFSEDSTRYCECIFKIKYMEKFNGLDCLFHRDGLLTIFDENDNEIWENFVYKIPEFCEKTLRNEVNTNIKIKEELNNNVLYQLNIDDFYMALEEMEKEKRTQILKKYCTTEIKDIFQRKFSPNWIEDIQNFIECYLL